MQIMPDTARYIARKLGEPYEPSRVAGVIPISATVRIIWATF